MRRILLLAAMLTVALPSAAQASVIPTVAADTLTVTGDGAADSITLRLASPTSLEVNGAAFDRSTFSKIAIRSGGGDDTIRIADALSETVTIESGAGADAVTGGPGRETVTAGDGTDLVHPGAGDDSVFLGAGDDTLIQGDGFDQVDGQAGADTLQATGSDEQEEFTLQAAGTLLRVARDTGPATTESRDVEALDVIASGGADLIDSATSSRPRSPSSTPTSATSTERATRSRSRAPTRSTCSRSGRTATTSRSRTSPRRPHGSATPVRATTA